MKAPNETSDQPRAASPHGPVFVDASGRRLRRVKLLGLGALGIVAGYVVLLLVALMGGSNVAAPYLPLPAAAGTGNLPSSPPAPASHAGNLQGAEGPAAVPAAPAAFQVPVAAPQAVPVAPPAAAALPPAAPAGAVVAPAATGKPTAPGMSSSVQGANELAPGQATRPSSPPRP
ncbi:hypothetical protein FBY31_0407 [Arthrobacter sp. SLBN-100]|uniref:hypothetical protein n=1 Tax=Arthrobacter sp. SLBN-100 TaxID=2768450 RepID=UPI001150B31B|nr:hypothetical protein [Arthrobacter sp. SLBN-100]TQJ66398.1 hypothetical protein FBY31_0407 [Arthrobacter sp. SLBN-100]